MLTLSRSWREFARGLVCVRGFKGRVLLHSDSTAILRRFFSEYLSTVREKHSVPILCSPVWAVPAPRTFKVHQCSTFPLRSSGRRILNYLDDRLILARSLDTLISHIDSLFYSLRVPKLWEPASREDRVGDETLPLVRSRGMKSLPLVRSRGNESSLSRDRAAANCLPAPFRQGSSVQLRVLQRLLVLKVVDSAVLHPFITHAARPLQLWLVISSPVNGVDFGRLAHRGHIEALTQPRCARWSRWMHRLTAGD